MGTFRTFEDIEAWKLARDLTANIYRFSKVAPFSKDFGLRDQMRRAAVSVMSNIAEGFERAGTKEFIHFLSMAKGSAGELEAQLYVALDQSYITQDEFGMLKGRIGATKRLIGGLSNYLRESGFRGVKYK